MDALATVFVIAAPGIIFTIMAFIAERMEQREEN